MLYLNGNPVPTTIFPDNTSQVWKLPEEILNETNYARITWKFTHEGEIMHLGQLKMLLQLHKIRASLILPYFPYGRQDKEISNTSTFALRNFAHFINMMDFEEVIITDPHSEVALELIRRSKAVYPLQHLVQFIDETKADIVCYPDKGALNKYSTLPGYDTFPYIYGEKVRDQLTGKITNYSLFGDCKDKSVLIVDDICDYGNTFILLAKELLALGAKEVNLFVSHGLFSGGIRVLKDAGIKRISTKEGEPLGDRVRTQV